MSCHKLSIYGIEVVGNLPHHDSVQDVYGPNLQGFPYLGVTGSHYWTSNCMDTVEGKKEEQSEKVIETRY